MARFYTCAMTSETVAQSERGDGRGLRARLLRTSRELLDAGGPSALSMREVARRSGCTHQAPYHYFANREAILAALVREGFEDLADHLSAAHDGLEAQGLHATLIASGHAYVEFARLVRMVADERAAPEVETLFWAGVHGLAALLLDGPLAGELETLQERLEFARRVGLVAVPLAGFARRPLGEERDSGR